jgi:hypothetical protein
MLVIEYFKYSEVQFIKYLENANTNGNAEMRISKDMGDGFRLSGVIDLYNEKEKLIEDYKTASVNKILFKDFSEWEKQGLIYWFLLHSQDKDAKELRFHAMLKDWVARKLMLAKKQGNDYPNSAIWTWTHKITDKDKKDIEDYINERFKLLKQYYDTPDDELPPCSSEECWYTGNKYAVMKKGRKTALRVFEDFDEAKAYMSKNGGDYIEHREGEYRRCEDYCDCNMYCSEYLKRKGE